MKINRIGETNINNQGLKMTIIEYRKHSDIDLQFEDGHIIKNREYGNFKKGTIRNSHNKDIYNIGFTGEGNYKSKENDKITKSYNTWHSILQRCYSEKCQEKHLTYKGCKVCEEWLNFQNFAKWFEENIWSNDCTVLDKDILVKGNKMYSPETCVLVDKRLNSLFTKRDKSRGVYPIGVSYNKRNEIFQTNCSANTDGKNKSKYLGLYNTPQEAFEVYKTFKEKRVKQIADEYKSKYKNFPQRLYNAMYDYEVNIED